MDALKRLRPNTFRYGWQTYAWSAGHWQAWAQLRQVAANQYIGGVNCDIDEAWSTDYGGYIWGSSNRFANEPTIRLGANDRNYPVGVHPIKDLQNALNSAFGAGLVVDGAFGSATESAVRRFQAAALGGELTADGIVGPFTWAKLDLILDWQGKKYGATESAVRRFQAALGGSLTADGIVLAIRAVTPRPQDSGTPPGIRSARSPASRCPDVRYLEGGRSGCLAGRGTRGRAHLARRRNNLRSCLSG